MTRILLSRLLILFAATVFGAAAAMAQDFQDSDWSLGLYRNCALPAPDSVSWVSKSGDQKLQFKISPKDVGGCSSDARARNGARFWERAELRQRGGLAKAKTHDIRFQATVVSGFTGREETFFQIHGWTSKCSSAPLVMMRFHRKRLEVHVLKKTSDRTKSGAISRGEKGALVNETKSIKLRRDLTLAKLAGKPLNFQVLFDADRIKPRLTVKMNGQTLVDNAQMYVRDCSNPHVKAGIYRPGKQNKKTSILWFDDLTIRTSG